MSNDVRGLLRDGATRPTADADVAGAWSRGRRLRARRLAVTGLATAAIVAVGTIAAVNLIPNDHNTKPLVPATSAPAACAAPSKATDDVPDWAASAGSLAGIAHQVSPDGNVVAFIFGNPLRAGAPTGRQNKVLWVVRQPRGGQPLAITATLPPTDFRVVRARVPAGSSPGEIYPSTINVPTPGCWHFTLAWNGHRSSMDLAYKSAETPAPRSTTTTSTAVAIGPADCHTKSMTISVGPPNGAAGHVGFEISFRNDSTATCLLSGYPGVSFLDASGKQIGVPVTRNPMAHTPVTVAPDATAYALLVTMNPDVANCPAGVASRIRIYPPNETAPAFVAAVSGLRVCAAQSAPGYVNPVVDTANY